MNTRAVKALNVRKKFTFKSRNVAADASFSGIQDDGRQAAQELQRHLITATGIANSKKFMN